MSKKIKGEILEIKETVFFPVCAECKYVYLIEEKGIFKKMRHAGCMAQGYRFTCDVYGSEACKNIFRQQLSFPLMEVKQEK